MNPDEKKPPSDLMGHIPRKKKLLVAGASAVAGTMTAAAPPAAAAADIPIPRKKKPKMQLLQRAQDQEHFMGGGSERSVNDSSQSHQHSRPAPHAGGGGSGRLSNEQHRRPSHDSVETGQPLFPESSRVLIVSESPFVVRINTRGVPRFSSGVKAPPPLHEPSSFADLEGRSPSKRSRPSVTTYKELEDTDSDDFLTEVEEQNLLKNRMKKRRKNLDLNGGMGEKPDAVVGTTDAVMMDAMGDLLAPSATAANCAMIDSPPPGILSTLWYSRECFLHVFVMEKICGWKTRPKVQLVEDVEDRPELESDDKADAKIPEVAKPPLDLAEATRLQQRAFMAAEFRTDPKRRMEISRINPVHCPIVMAMAVAESHKPIADPAERKKRYKLQPVSLPAGQEVAAMHDSGDQGGVGREEVLLIKWRGRSYMHCSWERASDIERLDPSTNNTARNKVRRFYQNQENVYGLNWKQVLEEERTTASAIHHHGSGGSSENATVLSTAAFVADDDSDQVEEYFSPQCLMVERILACDENEMDMQVLARQRAINMRDEHAELTRKDREQLGVVEKKVDLSEEVEMSWDPEDNVRYVVKWKGLPYVDMTWEYWRDIKRDAVDEAEDFWYRQQAPDLELMRQCANRPHPHMRDFKKLQASPAYGMSKKPRPIAKLEGDDDDTDMTVPESDPGFRLRSYQLEGVNWLLFNWWNRRSCILADEMGLGKTIQSAAFLQELQTQPAAQVRGPFLIVAPLSLIDQWQSELHSWAPDVNVILYHGSADARDFLVKQEFYYSDQFVPKATAVKLKKLQVTKFHVLITTYEVVLKDIAVLSKIRWKTLIVDEAHRLKNHKARLFDELASVPRDHCVLLTGTPIANATEELWALLHFANPRTFKERDEFLEKFGEMTDAKQVNELHALLKPYLLRRVKEDVEKSLPNKEETILEVSLTPIQKTFYKAIYERNTAYLFKGTKPNNAPSLMNVMMELRKCCNHPFLVKGAEERILKEAAAKLQGKNDELGNEVPIDHNKLFAEQLVKSSGKMVLMEKLLQKLFDGGHKVLVFSQMVRVLDLLEDLLKIKKYRYERLDGTTSSSSRLHAVDRFKKKACNRFVMLLSTRAGGLGLNLTVADIVIIFDSDWNPQNDMQAMARAHRIGQTRAVKVYRFLTAKTYEMHMFHSASLKLGLERAVLSQNREQSEESDDAAKSTRKSDREAQAKEIDELLKKGAYDVFRDDDDREAEKFMETDIDQLLEHSAKTVSYGAAATSSLGSGLGSFSKASFVANTEGGEKDVDLDDPDFWSKAVGLEAPPEETPEEVAAMIDDGVKRSRKQVQQYDPYAETAMAEQLKKDRIAIEKMLEKEEKERLLEEKKAKKKKAKEERRRKLLEEQAKLKQLEQEKNPAPSKPKESEKVIAVPKNVVKVPKLSKEVKPKKTKKSDRVRALRRAENEDPLIERFKQAWEIPQRNRATAAAIRFGFGRFCKLRNESNLTSLPLQDLEVFIRSYFYQLSLQVAVTILARIREELDVTDVRALFQEWLGLRCAREVDWICDSMLSAMKFQAEVESCRRFLRMPIILAEPTYVADLRHGAGFRALRRVGILARLNSFIEECLDSILSALGHEELGKRGCGVNELATLDADLKSRYVTTEELALAIGSSFQKLNLKAPASWWDRSCDVGLVIGTFVHGLGNYEVMRRDRGLPFGEKILRLCERDPSCKIATQRFRAAASSTRKVFDDALEAGRIKAELEVQAAVAAAAKAALQREEDAALLRKGGAEAEVAVRNMPETQVEDAFEFDGTDSHFVTLPRMHQYMQDAVRSFKWTRALDLGKTQMEIVPDTVKSEGDAEGGGPSGGRVKEHHLLPMPDSRVLDYRLVRILDEIERTVYGQAPDNCDSNLDLWQKSKDVLTSLQVRSSMLPSFDRDSCDVINEYAGVGLGGNQCGISHRTLNDGSDFSFGSASSQIAQLAYGTDAPRYLRALGVPMNVTRFAISGLVYAEASCVKELLTSERLRYFGKEEAKSEATRPAEVQSNENPRFESEAGASIEGKPVVHADNSASNDSATVNPGDIDDGISESAQREQDVKQENYTVDGWMHTSSRPKVIEPIDPVELIPDIFRKNARLRANVCLAVAFYGFPPSEEESSKVNVDLWRFYQVESGLTKLSAPEGLFDAHKFREVVAALDRDVVVPDAEALRKYVESVLLPHCLRLCVSGNGPSTRNARGSHGDYETAFGISIHPEPSLPHPSPLPDPCLSLQEHSLEALGFANALLRRVRLLRSSVYLCSQRSNVPASNVVAIAKSSCMGQLDGLPVWWCPWIHDIALLFQAATQGLFSVIANRSDNAIFPFVQSGIIARGLSLPEARHTAPEQVAAWAEHQAAKFPSLYQLERRLGSLCSEATAEIQSEVRFDYIPMFDHGGWPRD